MRKAFPCSDTIMCQSTYCECRTEKNAHVAEITSRATLVSLWDGTSFMYEKFGIKNAHITFPI